MSELNKPNGKLTQVFPFLLLGADVFMGFALQWLDFLTKTGLAFVEWEPNARFTAGIIGVVAALSVTVAHCFVGWQRVGVWFRRFCWAFFILLAACFFAGPIIDNLLSCPQVVEFTRDKVWFGLYALCGACLIALIASSAIILFKQPPASK